MNALTDIENNETLITSVETMQADLMGIIVRCCKAMPDVWQKMSQDTQDDFLESIDKQTSDAVETCVKHISANGRPFVMATVDQVVFKGGIEAKMKIERTHGEDGAPSGAHELADQTGQKVMIILPGIEEYESDERDKPISEDDQPDLLDSANDPLYDEAVKFVQEERKTTISAVQRDLKIGYNRAARLIEMMEQAGILSAPNESGAREILS